MKNAINVPIIPLSILSNQNPIIPIIIDAIISTITFPIICRGEIDKNRYIRIKFTIMPSIRISERVMYMISKLYFTANIIAGQRAIMYRNCDRADSLGFPNERYTSLL